MNAKDSLTLAKLCVVANLFPKSQSEALDLVRRMLVYREDNSEYKTARARAVRLGRELRKRHLATKSTPAFNEQWRAPHKPSTFKYRGADGAQYYATTDIGNGVFVVCGTKPMLRWHRATDTLVILETDVKYTQQVIEARIVIEKALVHFGEKSKFALEPHPKPKRKRAAHKQFCACCICQRKPKAVKP